ncbi:hypothetical protein L7F22_003810 [Adiantum nelumboides]|nr:hypothetical protein [Adiantum nelumboides]
MWKPEWPTSRWTFKTAVQFCKRVLLILSVLSFHLIETKGSGSGEDYSCLIEFKSKAKDTQNVLSSWTSSVHGEPPCNGSISSWSGIICDNNRVFSLTLRNAGLTGAISSNLSKCSALSTLDLSANRLTGEIPTSLGELSNLVSLNLSQNELTGVIPVQLSNCSYLNIVDLHSNALEGSIPAEFGNLERLQEFDVSHNGLSGQIPALLAHNLEGTARFNASSFVGNKHLYGFPLPNHGGHALSLIEIIGIGLASGIFSLSVSFTVVCLWLRISEQRRAADEGRISELMAEP